MARNTRPITRRRLIQTTGLAGGALLGGPLLSACGSDSDPEAANSNGDNGGRLVLGVPRPVTSFDPYAHNTPMVTRTLYSYLLDYTEDLTPIPSAAEDWDIAADNASFTIRLRETTFHSGEPITADDLVVGIERAQDPGSAITLGAPSAFIDTATAVDERTVRVDLKEPVPESIVTDWMFLFPVVPAANNNPGELDRTPHGSGPFQLASYEQDTRMVLEKNPNYWEAGKPYLDEVEYQIFDDEDSLAAALESGAVDGATNLGDRHAQRLSDKFAVQAGSGSMDLFFMNPSFPPFENRQLRQALARAIDRERIIEQVRFGRAEPVYTALTPNSPAFDPSYLDEYGFDLDAAEAQLEASGASTREATLVVGGLEGWQEIAQIIQSDLRKIGFEVTLDPMEQTAWLERGGPNMPCYIAGQPTNLRSPFIITQGAPYRTDNTNILWPDGPPDAYLEAIAATQTAITPEQQEAVNRQLNEALMDEVWAVGIGTRPGTYAFSKQVTGFALDPRDDHVLTETRVA